MIHLAVSWCEGPIVALDLETTNVNPHVDRIVTASVITISPRPGESPEVSTRTWLADPGVEIPADATALHGVSTEEARRDGCPSGKVVEEVADYLGKVWTASTPLCAFHAAFDLTLLDAELRRHHDRRLPLSGPVVDPLILDRKFAPARSNRRKLSDVCERYDVRLDKAHDGVQDALAAARLAWRMARRQPNEIGLVPLDELHSLQAGWFRAQELDFAGTVEWRARKLESKSGDLAEVAQLRTHAANVRAGATAWPLRPEPAAGPPLTQRRRPPRPGGARSSHATWTPDEETKLREEWLSAGPASDPAELRTDLAEQYGRSPNAIRSRLLKLRCDPESPAKRATSSAPPSSNAATMLSSGAKSIPCRPASRPVIPSASRLGETDDTRQSWRGGLTHPPPANRQLPQLRRSRHRPLSCTSGDRW